MRRISFSLRQIQRRQQSTIRTGIDTNIYKAKPGEVLRPILRADLEKERHEVLLSRIANQILNQTDNEYGKILQFYPESKDLVGLMGKVLGCMLSHSTMLEQCLILFNVLDS